MFSLKRISLVLDCVALCLEESLLSLAKLRLEEVWKSFSEHTKQCQEYVIRASQQVRQAVNLVVTIITI